MSISLTYLVENTDNIKSIRIISPINPSVIWYQKFRNENKNNIGTTSMPRHGKYSISINNQVLTMKAYDGWNIETVISCCEAFRVEAKKLMHKSWSCLVDLSEWELGPPGMLCKITELNIWSEKNNQVFEAVIVKNSVQKHFLENSHKAFKSIKPKFFDNHNDALCWLSNPQRCSSQDV